MNRRNFFTSLIKGAGVFSILPPAETYARIWKAVHEPFGIKEQFQALGSGEAPQSLEDFFKALYALKQKRLKMANSDKIEIWCRPEAALLA